MHGLKTAMVAALLLGSLLGSAAWATDAIMPLHIQGENFVDPQGQTVRLWGANLVAVYPDHAAADTLAAQLAERQINMVRPHHMLRPSRDWVTQSPITSLSLYQKNSRDPDPAAWDRFDYFNAALRKQGIYLMLASWWTRNYQPGDVDVLTTDDADRKAWSDAIAELNSWPWNKAFDARKMLAVVDERSAALVEEFTLQMLNHVNPYTHIAYGKDPQVLTLELLNECSSEYIIICGNKLPAYFQAKLAARWQAFAKQAGVEPGDLYQPADSKVAAVRAKFLRKLDEDFLLRMKAAVSKSGSTVAIAFSNLWRGENAQQLAAQHNDYIEDHMYADPLAAGAADDFIYKLINTPVAGKPYIVGELNQSEGPKRLAAETPVRSQLPLAVSAYGLLQNWSGITFFAWLHGDKALTADGRAQSEGRAVALGNMLTDGMMLDHLRTCGILFRRGLLRKSSQPITIHVDDPLWSKNYSSLMRSKYVLKPGWQNLHEIRKTYGPAPASQASAPWLMQNPANPLVSDTGQIHKDIARKQLTIAAPRAEAFSGFLDDQTPAGLKHLSVSASGFATVVVVADDDADLAQSRRLIISRTNTDSSGHEVDGPSIRLSALRTADAAHAWQFRITRPQPAGPNAVQKLVVSNGQLVLPGGTWHECELVLE